MRFAPSQGHVVRWWSSSPSAAGFAILSILALVCVPAGHAGPSSAVPEGPTQFTFQLNEEDVRIHRDGAGYDWIEIPEGLYPRRTEDIGAPRLPRLSFMLALPKGMAISSIEVSLADADTLPGTYNPTPEQGEEPRGSAAPPNQAIYGSGQPYPRFIARDAGTGTMRGVQLGSVEVAPVRFVGATGKLIVYRSARISAALAPLQTSRASEIRERLRSGTQFSRRRHELRWLEDHVVNPNELFSQYTSSDDRVLAEDTRLDGFSPTERPSTDRSAVEYVIITDDVTTSGTSVSGMTTLFQDLADWKTTTGIPAVVRTVSWIRTNYTGVDTQERIRNFIIDAYQKWGTDWVLLGGDNEIVPAREVTAATPPNAFSDFYYAALDGKMNVDQDRWFGESNDVISQVDPMHDVWVARVPADDSAQASAFLDKLDQYSLRVGESPAPPAYYSRMLFTTGFVNSGTWGSPSNGHSAAEKVVRRYLPASDISPIRLYEPVDTTCVITNTGPGCFITTVSDSVYRYLGSAVTPFESDEQLIDTLTAAIGVSYWYQYEHSHWYIIGGPSRCGSNTFCIGADCMECVDVVDGGLNPEDIRELTSADQPFLVVTPGSAPNGYEWNSISEQLLVNQGGGAMAFLGRPRSSTSFAQVGTYEPEFFKQLFVEGHPLFSQTAALATLYLPSASERFRLSASWVPMGDPSMDLWTAAPEEITVTVSPDEFTALGPQTFTVLVETTVGEDPVEDALVCLESPTVYAAGFTGSDGQKAFTANVSSADDIIVTVTGHNIIPTQATIDFDNDSATALIQYTSHEISDATSTLANHNGVIDVGERIRVKFEMKNAGGAYADSVRAECAVYAPLKFDLSTNDQAITYVGAENSQPRLDGDSTFSLPANWYGIRPDGKPALLDGSDTRGVFIWRDMSDADNPWWTLVARGYPTSLVPDYYSLSGSIVTVGGFSDTLRSGFEAGDTFSLASRDSLVLNLSVETDGADTLRFRAKEVYWTAWQDDEGFFGRLNPNATANDTVRIDLASEIPDGHELTFTVVASDSSGQQRGLSEFSVPVHAPIVEVRGLTLVPNCFTEPCSYILRPRVRNRGTGRADSVSGRFTLWTGSATVTDPLIGFGSLEPGQEKYLGSSDQFVFTAWDPSTVTFSIELTNHCASGDSGLVWTYEGLDVNRPTPPSLVDIDPGYNSARVTWSWSGSGADSLGFNVYRGTSSDSTTFVRRNAALITGSRLYEDRGLSPDTLYYYAVTLQDQWGNESYFSARNANRAYPPVHPGWPRRTDGGTAASVAIADLDGDDALEVLAVGLTGIYAWKGDGDEFLDGDGDPATDLPFVLPPLLSQSRGFYATPAIADIDSDDEMDIVFTRWEDSLYVYEESGARKWARRICADHIFDTDGPGWSSPAIGNIKGGSDSLEIVIGSTDGVIYAFTASGAPVLGSGASCEAGVFDKPGRAFLYQSLALANLETSTPQLEVVAATGAVGGGESMVIAYAARDTLSGGDGYADRLWTYETERVRPCSSPVIGPLTADDDSLKIAVTVTRDLGLDEGPGADFNDEIVILDAHGNQRRRIPEDLSGPDSLSISENNGNPTPPIIADVDRDGIPEIVVGGRVNVFGAEIPDRTVRVYVYDYADNALRTQTSIVPKSVFAKNIVINGAAVADVDADGNAEMLFGLDNFGFFAWQDSSNNTFRVDRGWPIMLNGEVSNPAVGDVDGDGKMEVAVSDQSGRVHLFDLSASADSLIEWSQFGGGARHTFTYDNEGGPFGGGSRSSSTLGLEQNYPNPFNPVTTLRFGVAERGRVQLRVYDVMGRLVRVILDEVLEPGQHSVMWDGRNTAGMEVASGMYVASFSSSGVLQQRKLLLLR